jgi:hypothetical protein
MQLITPTPRGTTASLVALLASTSLLCTHATQANTPPDISQLPPPSPQTIDFNRDIQPILESACLRCHGNERPKGGFRLTDRQAVLSGGNYGPAVIPGNSANSPLIHYVANLVPDMEMPPVDKGTPLTPNEISLLRAWIDQDLPWSTTPTTPQRELTISPSATWISVSGNKSQFREHTGLREGASGGLQDLFWREQIDRATELILQGRGLLNQDDYRLSLQIRRRDTGSIGFGVETRNEYDNNTGLYTPQAGYTPTLNRDLDSQRGRTWIDLALTLPDWPAIQLGYEYRWRDGNLSTLSRGIAPATPPSFTSQGTLPNYRHLAEHTHIAKLNLSYNLAGWHLEDYARIEFYDLNSRKNLQGDGAPDLQGSYRETYEHTQTSNVLKAEKQLLPWLLTSAGYLYANLQGDGSFSQTTTITGPPNFSFAGDAAPDITLQQENHTLNANAQIAPWNGISLHGGLQAEWLQRDGIAGLVAPIDPIPGQANANLNRQAIDETATLKFDSIPLTSIYATGRWQQEWLDQQEAQTWSDSPFAPIGYSRASQATGSRNEGGTGINLSPTPMLSADASFWHRQRNQDFDHLVDRDLTSPPTDNANGYPALITGREVTGDEINTRISWRAHATTRITLAYQYSDTDYRTRTASSTIDDYSDPFAPVSVLLPGGELLAGHERAHTYSANLSLRLLRRLHLSTTFNYVDSHLDTAPTDDTLIAPYQGRTISSLNSATYVLTTKTHLRATYAYSHADYTQDTLTEGLPLGINYQRHTLNAALHHRLSSHLASTIAYGLFLYTEPTSNNANNYTAHAITASLAYRWN